jgi:hypothetical protein
MARSSLNLWARFVLIVCGISGATGCAARVYPAGVYAGGDSYVVYGDAPASIETYPRVEYDGGYAYYVSGRWYRHTPHGWGYYRQAPPELERRRAFVQRAPAREREERHVEVRPGER